MKLDKREPAVVAADYSCPMPSLFTIETGNVCNLRCPGCPTGRRDKDLGPGVLSYADFEVIFERIVPYAVEIRLYNWGEPFLNKDILPMISLSSEHHVATHIDTNLTVREFSAAEAEEVVGSGLTRLFASIDGASQESYERYRVGGDFARAIANVRHLQEAKRRLGSETPAIAWKFLVNAFNEHEMDRAQAMARELGVPIYFDLMHVTDPSWYSSLHKKSIAQESTRVEARVSDEDVAVFDHSRRHRTPEEESGPAGLPKPIDEIRLHPQLFSWCMQPFNMAFIHWNGHLFPCCNVYGDAYSLGNLFTDRLEDIWNHQKLRSCRKFLLGFGPRQDTGSVCETLPCPVEKKYVR